MHRRNLLQLAAAPLLAAPPPSLANLEVRAMWIHPERSFGAADPAEGRRQVRAMVERLARARFNLILPWITSDYLAALTSPVYAAKIPSAKWDSLGVLIEEGRRAGLAVDIWYSFTDYRAPGSAEFNPAVGGNPAWSARYIYEVINDPATGGHHKPPSDNVCPQHFEARAWQLAQLESVLSRYPALRGLHIEEPGYREKGYCLCDLCQRTFQSLYGRKLVEVLDTEAAEDFRALGTSAFIAELRALLARRFPRIVLSANGGYDWRRDRVSGRDWGRWARTGWLRYYASQVYVTDTAEFRRKTARTLDDIGRDTGVYAGIALDWSTGKNTIAEVIRQINASWEMGCPGVCLFHGAAFSDDDLKLLADGPFRAPAPSLL